MRFRLRKPMTFDSLGFLTQRVEWAKFPLSDPEKMCAFSPRVPQKDWMTGRNQA